MRRRISESDPPAFFYAFGFTPAMTAGHYPCILPGDDHPSS